MFTSKSAVLLAFSVFSIQFCNAGRRIMDGIDVTTPKRFMVYLTRAMSSDVKYDAWICGGVLVSKNMIVTSAACVEDVKFMYAIAGYSKYVRFDEIDNDECTRGIKKKIVQTCVPKIYHFEYHQLEKWSKVDIATAILENEYNFDGGPPPGCEYAPDEIRINFDYHFQKPGTSGYVLGWGHREKWRQREDDTDLNVERLKYAPLKIVDNSVCKNAYAEIVPKSYPNIIDKYMFCGMGKGDMDDQGEVVTKANDPQYPYTLVDHCKYGQFKPECREGREGGGGGGRMPMPTDAAKFASFHNDLTRKQNENGTFISRRYPGICQNDHGGPFISWIGGREHLIGVSSVFKIDDNYDCEGPFLFTSTYCNSQFLHCLLTQNKRSLSRREFDEAVKSGNVTKHYVELNRVTYIYNGTDQSTPQVIKETEIVPLKDAPEQREFPLMDWNVKDTFKSKENDKQSETYGVNNTLPVPTQNSTINNLNESSTEPIRYNVTGNFSKANSSKHDNNDSTTSTENFNNKVLRMNVDICYQPAALRGFDVTETRISWLNHPDGPAQNEILEAQGIEVRMPTFKRPPPSESVRSVPALNQRPVAVTPRKNPFPQQNWYTDRRPILTPQRVTQHPYVQSIPFRRPVIPLSMYQ